MSLIGYARVSSTGQSLEVQLGKLNQVKCNRIYPQKRSGTTAERLEFQSCMNYLREVDTLVVTRFNRLARSVFHLAQLAKLTETIRQEIHSKIASGVSIGSLAKEFGLGEASIYRAINAVKQLSQNGN